MSSANIIREMGFVKGFRLKNLSLRVKPLNLRGGGDKETEETKETRDQRDLKRPKGPKRSLGH